MDKRVIRTKRTIKETLVKLLQKTQFEHITVKTICDEACTSRITFIIITAISMLWWKKCSRTI